MQCNCFCHRTVENSVENSVIKAMRHLNCCDCGEALKPPCNCHAEIAELNYKYVALLNQCADLSQRINKQNSSLCEFEKQRVQPKFEEIKTDILELKRRINITERSIDNKLIDVLYAEVVNPLQERIDKLESYANEPFAYRKQDQYLVERIEKLESVNKHPEPWALQVELYTAIDNIVRLGDRIERLENWTVKHEKEGLEYGNDFEKRDSEFMARIEKLEDKVDMQYNMHHEHYTKIEKLESDLQSEVSSRKQLGKYMLDRIGKPRLNETPEVCPKCQGAGFTQYYADFAVHDVIKVKCNCGGSYGQRELSKDGGFPQAGS